MSYSISFARSHNLPIAVRGGGHSSSTASATEGLLIDLRKLNNIRVDEDAKVGYIQPGALICDIEVETIKYGLGACVGICSQVSIGGYTVGGGIGYFTRAHGLAADNLISATVVLANGEIVEASEMENADLLRGIRGGGSNFGVLAELRVKLHSQRADAYAVSYTYPPSRINEVVEEINRWRQVQKLHETVFMLIRLGPDKQPYVLVNGLSNSTQEEGEAAFNRFLDLGPVQTINVQIPWTAACNLANDINTVRGGKLFCGAHIDVFDAAQVQKSFETWEEMVKKAPSSLVMYEFYHYGKVAEHPLESAAFAQRHELMTVLCSCMGFEDIDDYAPYARDELLKLRDIVAASSSKAAQESLGYANYGDLFCTLNETDEYTKKIFGSNYPRLQEIKKNAVKSESVDTPLAGGLDTRRGLTVLQLTIWYLLLLFRLTERSFKQVNQRIPTFSEALEEVSGSTFGVVVELAVKLHPQRADAYSISYVYLPIQLPEVVEAIKEYRRVQNPRESVFFLRPYVIINGLSNSSKEEGEAAFNRFLDLKPVDLTTVQVPWAQNPLGIVPGGKIFVGAHIDKFDVEQAQKPYDVWQEVIKKTPFSVVMYEFLDYGKFARSHNLPIAVRGGGHSSSTASATEGLLIDLRKLSNIRVDEGAKIGYIQPGARVCDIEVETIKYGLGACVGICSEVSIGGYTVGGGIGFSTGAHGLGADNLISATVVLANGDVVEASETENVDLLWGIRGGGSNFGVLAELRVKLHPQRADAYAVSYTYPPTKINEVVEEINRWRLVQKVHETIFLLISLGPDKQPYVLVNGISNSSQEEGEAAFERFVDLGPVQTINTQIPWAAACNLANDMNNVSGGKLFCGAHIDVFDAAQVQTSFEAWQEMVKKAPKSILMYEFYHYGKIAERPLESAAFAQRHELMIVLCACMGIGDDYAPYARDELLKLRDIVAASSSKAAQESLGYANYGDLFCTLNETDEYTRKIFGSNYPRLQEIKKKYDPDMVFNRWFAIQPED
ncbi:hypothetical protein FS837_012816 [Tulasnella sp. UAMH 9824]|nr:hypothetical protein FS837_012816 [Tulasnella sp. UAMH 9824]